MKCGVDGEWISPNETDWPICIYKDEYSCDPVEEIDKTPAYLASGNYFSVFDLTISYYLFVCAILIFKLMLNYIVKLSGW